MYQTINFSQFCDAFRAHDRNEQFSYEAKRIIFDYLEQLEEDTGGIELDVVGICCEWAEMDADEVINSYPAEFDPEELADMSEEDILQLVHDYIADNTIIGGMTDANSFVFVQF